MCLFEPAVDFGQGLGEAQRCGIEPVDRRDPGIHLRGHEWPRDRSHSPGKRPNVMFTEVPGHLPIRRAGMRSHLPDRRQCRVVNLPDLGQTQDGSGVTEPDPVDGLPVHPLGRRRIAPDLQILPEFPIADGAPFRQETLDLLEHQRIALDGRGVMGLPVPDSAPDAGSFLWAR